LIAPAPQDRINLAQAPLGVQRFRVTFNTPGTFNYICALHDELDMVGKVIVKRSMGYACLAIWRKRSHAVLYLGMRLIFALLPGGFSSAHSILKTESNSDGQEVSELFIEAGW
jgi:hypothetical protein